MSAVSSRSSEVDPGSGVCLDVPTDVDRDDVGALLGQPDRMAAALPARRAGDERHLACSLPATALLLTIGCVNAEPLSGTIYFCTLPLASASELLDWRSSSGHFWLARPADSKCARTSSRLGISSPGLILAHRDDVFPKRSSGAATATASATSGMASSASSTSTALMFSPPRMMTSALRSVMVSVAVPRPAHRCRRCDTSRHRRRPSRQVRIEISDAQIGPPAEDFAVGRESNSRHQQTSVAVGQQPLVLRRIRFRAGDRRVFGAAVGPGHHQTEVGHGVRVTVAGTTDPPSPRYGMNLRMFVGELRMVEQAGDEICWPAAEPHPVALHSAPAPLAGSHASQEVYRHALQAAGTTARRACR